jgi:hypothetical protein
VPCSKGEEKMKTKYKTLKELKEALDKGEIKLDFSLTLARV